MMVNKNKRKGSDWENLLVDLLDEKLDNAKVARIAGSGAIGTTMHEPLLQGDVILQVPGFAPRKFRIECKVGYGGAKQITMQKEWIDKIIKESFLSNSIPALAIKFSGARKADGVQYAVVLDLDTFCNIINYVTQLQKELEKYG